MMLKRIAPLLLAGVLTNLCLQSSQAQQCNLNQKQIIYSYAPQLCTQDSCVTTQKLLVLGRKIISYFKGSGTVEAFKSLGLVDKSNEDVAVGFIYTLDSDIDALKDRDQAQGLKYALAQLSPGTKYLAYNINASQAGNILKLETDARLDLAYVGEIRVQISTQIKIMNCYKCEVAILISEVLKNQSKSQHDLPVRSCSFSDMSS